jgi:DNA-binding NtrC family response regulator
MHSTDATLESRRRGRAVPPRRPLAYLAEDDLDTREALVELLAQDGLMVRAAPDGACLFDWLFRDREESGRLPDVIITDHRMPGFCGLDILDALAEAEWIIPVIVITAFGRDVYGMASIRETVRVLEKPFEPQVLRQLTRECLAWRARQLEPLRNRPAESRAIARVRKAVARTDDRRRR